MTIREICPAKLNLGLRILRKRDDGFHDILSVFQTVTLCDELDLTPAARTELAVEGVPVDAGDDNLVLKAGRLFGTRFGLSNPVSFGLKKRIPVGAGLGGGSSDAAAALRGLRRLARPEIGDDSLIECAAELGSDVPFAIRGGTAVVSGRGDVVTPVAWPFDFTYVIVHPGFGVSTAWAYGHCRPRDESDDPLTRFTGKLAEGTACRDDFIAGAVNDFEPVVFGEYPALAEVKRRLVDQGAETALMTGSGSAVFGVFPDALRAESCAGALKGVYPTVATARAFLNDLTLRQSD